MGARVLVVDDESGIRRIVQFNLERAGYTVALANDGVEALEKIRSDRPDLVLLDVMMPHMDGFETLRRLKRDPETADIPVMMVTAQTQDPDVFESERSGSVYYLTKPFSPMALLAAVQEVLSAEP